MNIEEIETFLAIIDKRTLNQASVFLNLSQSSISKRLNMLEDELGYKLIIRNKGIKGIELTDKGMEFVPIAEQWMRLWRETQMIKSYQHPCFLSIGSVDSVSNYILAPIYDALLHSDQCCDFQVKIQHSVELYKLIDSRELDIAFVIIKMNSPCIKVEPFITEPMVVLRLASEGRINGGTINPKELDPLQQIYYSDGPVFQIWYDKWWGRSARPKAAFYTCSTILSVLHEKDQWSIVPLSFANYLSKTGHYVYSVFEDSFYRTCYKLTHIHPRRTAEQGLRLFEKLSKNVKSVKPPTC